MMSDSGLREKEGRNGVEEKSISLEGVESLRIS